MTSFPPPPAAIKGRQHELRALAAALRRAPDAPIVLLGGGGTGKSLLACALGHRVARHHPGGIHWFRAGVWDHRTLLEMLALHFGAPRASDGCGLRATLATRARTFIVLDNHENDRAMARLLETLRGCPVTWLLTARRCLLSGVSIFPVVAPLAMGARPAFPRVAGLTALLRWNPLALDIADALVGSRAVAANRLRRWLLERGAERVAVMDDEDDVVEVRLLVDWAWTRLPAGARRMMAVLAHGQGDHIGAPSLRVLSGAGAQAAGFLRRLRRWRLVQEPLKDRYALHAVVRRAVARRTRFSQARFFAHYARLLERRPDLLEIEQSNLFAAMDHAHQVSSLGASLRIERLLERL
ncbi:MAG TPA: hypothetical protein VMU50_05785 [Polyangia bacterium]|nr:hypothetical protein [Polyangia bacterium]